MQLFKRKRKARNIEVPVLVFLFLFCGGQTVWSDQLREQLIIQELDCLSKNPQLTWQDVCYTQSPSSKRDQEIAKALDQAEQNHSRPLAKAQQFNNKKKIVKSKKIAESAFDRPYAWDQLADEKEYEMNDDFMDEPSSWIVPKLTLLGGYREDDLQWSIAGTPAGTSPNILSELTWTDLRMTQIKGQRYVI